jgi:hypothetical protein
MLKNLGLGIILVALSSCFLGELPPSSNAQEQESNVRLMSTYSALTGVYEGYLQENPEGEADIPVRLELFMAFEPAGRNEDGETKFVPVLQAFYKRLDVEDARRNYFIRSIRYYKESGQLLMSTEERFQTSLPGVGYLFAEARLSRGDTKLIGRLTDHRGPQGILRLEKLASSH